MAGRLSVTPPKNAEIINVETTSDMHKAVMQNLSRADVIIKAAAPSDYKAQKADKKLKKEKLVLSLEKTVDIAKEIGAVKGDRKLVVFAAETNDLIENAKQKLKNKNADLIVANDITIEGAGFQADTNIATIIRKDGELFNLPKMTKRELSDIILDNILK